MIRGNVFFEICLFRVTINIFSWPIIGNSCGRKDKDIGQEEYRIPVIVKTIYYVIIKVFGFKKIDK